MGRGQRRNNNNNKRRKQQQGRDRCLHESQRRAAAKSTLMVALEAHDGLTKHPEVQRAVTKLAKLNPTAKPARSELLLGKFVAISSPQFPGRLESSSDGNSSVFQYTLGKLSFGLFEPHALVCTLRQVHTDIEVLEEDDDDGEEETTIDEGDEGSGDRRNATKKQERLFAYPLISDLIIHTPTTDLSAVLHNRAKSYIQSDSRMAVVFMGGTLSPSQAVLNDPVKFDIWKQTFADAYKKAEQERSLLSSFLRYILKIVLKLSTPTDEDAEKRADNSFSFEIKRSPRGHYDVLYLDEELRISKGNRGTIVIMQRIVEEDEEEEDMGTV